MLFILEVIGWIIIAFELFGKRTQLASFTDRLNDKIVQVLEAFYQAAFGSFSTYLQFVGCMSVLVIGLQYFLSDQSEIIYRYFGDNAFETFHYNGEKFKVSHLRPQVILIAGCSVVLAGLLRLMKLHPSGTLGAIGFLLALVSSIVSRN